MIQLILAGVASAFLIASTAYITHEVDQARFDTVEQGYKDARQKAVDDAVAIQQKQSAVALAAALDEAKAQAVIQTHIETVIKEVPKYVHVKVPVGCVSFGLVRVLDAAALGSSASELPLPAGKSNDSCTGLSPVDLAQHIAGNYGRARADAKQLNDLIATVRAMTAAANTP